MAGDSEIFERRRKAMTQETWTAVDQYINDVLIPNDPVLEAVLRSSADAGLPSIQVSPPQGKLLHLLVRAMGAHNVLEIGTLGGYSTIWMARALPSGGRVLTLEADAKHAEVAWTNFARASLTGVIEQRLGPALDTLPKIAAEGLGPFDLIFIDANKSTMAEYFEWSLKLSRPGSIIIADNVIRNGAVVDAASKDADIRGVRRFNERLAEEKRVSATEIQTVGSKGYDGFALALVLSD
jgi:predicted O-methyltransferase YrrM